MAKKKVEKATVHLLDRTMGNEDAINSLMCGNTVSRLKWGDIALDPADSRTPGICSAADAEGKMCPWCKRCTSYFAKGVYVGGLRERQSRATGVMSTRDN